MITINNLLKKYENGNVAINDVSLKIADVGLVALVGASGAGKTTLLNLLAMNDKPTGGHIDCDGIEYNEANRKVLSQQFAYIYQDYKLIENISAYNNLKIAMELSGRAESREEIIKVLQRVGIEEYADELVMNLSGGQKQRVAIARALIRNPKALFADEPTGNLDSENTNNIFTLLKELSEKMLVVLVTHDTDTIKLYADRIIKLQDGKVISDNVEAVRSVTEKSQSHEESLRQVSSSKKPKLSVGSVGVLAKSLNNAKKGRRIVFSIVIVIMISLLIFLATWSLLTYNKSVVGTLNSAANVKGVIINLDTSSSVQGETLNASYQHAADLTKVSEYIETELGGKTAKVIRASSVKTRYAYSNVFYSKNIDRKPISLAHMMSKGNVNNIILSDNPLELGIEIIKGRTPSAKNEVAISDGMFDYVVAVGGIRNPDINSSAEDRFVRINEDDIIGYEVNDVTIVGVFDDKLDLEEKYYTYSACNESSENLIDLGDDLENVNSEVMHKVNGNILSNSIIASTATQGYYNDTINISSGKKYIQVDLIAGGSKTFINIMPANPDTVYWTKTEKISQDEIIIPYYLANSLGISEGESVQLSSAWMFKEEDSTIDDHILENIAKKEYKVKISQDVSYVVVNDNEYDVLSDNYMPSNEKIFFHKNNMTIGDLNKIASFVDENYKTESINKASVNLRFVSDYGDTVYDMYETMRLIKTLINIILAIVIVAYLLLSFNITGVVITSKANELLILKSLGATKRQFIGIYGIIASVQTVFEIVVGGVVGALLLFALNTIIGAAISTVVVLLPFDFITLGIMIGVVIAVNALSLIINIAKMNTKNLRKAFQSTHR